VLARLWRDHKDIEAAHKLVTSHLRLVAKIAMGYRGYGLPVGDLITEGSVGMMQAVKRYDPDRGFRLATHAMWWIRAAVQEYILRSSSLVKIGTTAAQKKLFFNLRRLKHQMQAIDDGDLQPQQVSEIAKALGVSEREVVSMNRRMAAPDYSLNAPVHSDDEGERQDLLADESDSQETALAAREELAGRGAAFHGHAGAEPARTANRHRTVAEGPACHARRCWRSVMEFPASGYVRSRRGRWLSCESGERFKNRDRNVVS
jgi:RNA polymerase sigma-32 factor